MENRQIRVLEGVQGRISVAGRMHQPWNVEIRPLSSHFLPSPWKVFVRQKNSIVLKHYYLRPTAAAGK